MNVTVYWKVANSLSDIRNQKQILGDGNWGFRAILQGLQNKNLIKDDDKHMHAINVFYLRKNMYDFAESHYSGL